MARDLTQEDIDGVIDLLPMFEGVRHINKGIAEQLGLKVSDVYYIRQRYAHKAKKDTPASADPFEGMPPSAVNHPDPLDFQAGEAECEAGLDEAEMARQDVLVF